MCVPSFWDREPTGRRRPSEHMDVLVARPRRKVHMSRRPVRTTPTEFNGHFPLRWGFTGSRVYLLRRAASTSL